jgi:hypothetical protein
MELKMKNKDRQPNYKVFIPVGITFIGAGVTFLIAVNSMVGVGMIAVGVAFVIIGAKKSREDKNSS